MLSRRSLFQGALAALPLGLLWQRTARAGGGGFGPLIADPAGILDLPAGFSYRIIDQVGDAMTDGFRVPGRPDGMACFAGAGGTLILMRNHELSSTSNEGPYGPGQGAPPQAFDADELGGVTRVVLDAATLERVSSNLVLTGTIRNCAGGTSPWGWLSCEETTVPGHGFVFVCPATAPTVQAAQPVPAYGRFNHEAAVVDPATMIAYLTEDESDSCFYRFVPDAPGAPFVGTLQALRVVGMPNLITANGDHDTGTVWNIEWVDLASPDPAIGTVRAQGHAQGAARVRRGEGLWLANGAVYFSSTSGGVQSHGQIFRLDPVGDGGTLTLLAQSTSVSTLDYPDNITVAPWGDIYMAEDGDGEQFVRVLDTTGAIHDFARNAGSDSELAGACFSPDGAVLFVNIQVDGITLAITGPFPVDEPEPVVDAGPQPDAEPEPVDPTSPDAGVDEPVDPGDGGEEAGGCSASGGGTIVGAALVVAAGARMLR